MSDDDKPWVGSVPSRWVQLLKTMLPERLLATARYLRSREIEPEAATDEQVLLAYRHLYGEDAA
jgi:hypothetical protein